MRLIASTVVQLIANAAGLLVANALLDDMELDASGFVGAVALFTLAFILVQPALQKAAMTKQSSLMGGTALVASLIALIVVDVVSDGVSIAGFGTWIAAAVIIWAAALLATFLLPLVIFKKTLGRRQAA